MHTLHLLICLFISLTQALNITYPTANTTVDASQNLTITWTTAPSDPKQITINLSGAASTGSVSFIAVNISTSAQEYTVPGGSYNKTVGQATITINSIGSEGNAFVAQSGIFTVEDTNEAPTSASSGAAAPTASSTSSAMAGVVTRGLGESVFGAMLTAILCWFL